MLDIYKVMKYLVSIKSYQPQLNLDWHRFITIAKTSIVSSWVNVVELESSLSPDSSPLFLYQLKVANWKQRWYRLSISITKIATFSKQVYVDQLSKPFLYIFFYIYLTSLFYRYISDRQWDQ